MNELIIPDGTEQIDEFAYERYPMERVWIPDSVKEIGQRAFSYCGSLREVRLPEGLQHVPCECFLESKVLEEIVLPRSVTCVEICAFTGCEGLKKVTWPDGLEGIEDTAFCATGLEEVELPEGLKFIGEDGFSNCPNLRRVILPSTVEYVGPWLASASPVFEGVVSRSPHFYVENDALICADYGGLICCWSKEKIYTMPAGVKQISGFSNKFVEELHVEQPLEYIAWDAFCGCDALKKISFAKVRKYGPGALNGLRNAEVRVAGRRIDVEKYSHV